MRSSSIIRKRFKGAIAILLVLCLACMPLVAIAAETNNSDTETNENVSNGTNGTDNQSVENTDENAALDGTGDGDVQASEDETIGAIPEIISHMISAMGVSFDSFGETATSLGSVVFDPSWLAPSGANSYNKELSKWSAMLAIDVYEDTVTWLDSVSGGSFSTKNFTRTLESYGFVDVEYTEVFSTNGTDLNDTSAVVCGHRIWTVDGVDYDMYVAVVPGTNSTKAQWISDLDVGANNTGYSTNMDAEHPDWTNKDNHKGFDVAATRVDKVIANYMTAHETEGVEKTLFMTGHSRGAAISNILGGAYEGSAYDGPTEVGAYGGTHTSKTHAVTSRAYTYNTPSTTLSATSERSSVYNIINGDDLFTASSISVWGFKHFGTDFLQTIGNVSMLKKYATSLQGGETYACPADLSAYDKIFLGIASSRDKLYNSKLDTVTVEFWSKSERDSYYNTTVNAVKAFGAEKYITVSKSTSFGMYQVVKTIKPAFELLLVANLAYAATVSDMDQVIDEMLALLDQVLVIFEDGFLNANTVTYKTTELVMTLVSDIDGLLDAHMMVPPYTLVANGIDQYTRFTPDSDPDNPLDDPNKKKTPGTGDNITLILIAGVVVVVALIAMVVAIIMRRKTSKK